MPSLQDVTLANNLPRWQRSVLVEVLNGLSEKEIAATLAISKHSVRTALKRIHVHFAVNSRYELCAKLLEFREPNPRWIRRPYAVPEVGEESPAQRVESHRCIDDRTAELLAEMEWSLLDVLDGLLAGCSERAIAEELEESPHTIHTRAKRIYKILGIASRSELFRLFTIEPQFLRDLKRSGVDQYAHRASSLDESSESE